jgi:tetratricopeptide (TPR) repeat protein
MRSKPVAAFLLVLAPTLLLVGCNKLRGRQYFHAGNTYYEDEQYRKALDEYERGLELDPDATMVWRSVGLAALALYRPGEEGAENKALGDKAIHAFEQYSEAYPEDQKAREYLVTTLMNAKRHDEAIRVLEEEAARHPNDRQYPMAVVRALTDAGKLQEAAARAQRLKDPDVFYTIGVAAWAKSYYTPPPSVDEHRAIIELGLSSLEQANTIRANHFDTLSYLNLLWREKVKVEIDPFKQQEYIANAQQYFDRAMEIRRQQQEAEAKKAKTEGAAKEQPAVG